MLIKSIQSDHFLAYSTSTSNKIRKNWHDIHIFSWNFVYTLSQYRATCIRVFFTFRMISFEIFDVENYCIFMSIYLSHDISKKLFETNIWTFVFYFPILYFTIMGQKILKKYIFLPNIWIQSLTAFLINFMSWDLLYFRLTTRNYNYLLIPVISRVGQI